MTPFELTLAALAETNPPVRAAVEAIGPSRAGDPRPGLLGWLPPDDRLDLCRAVCLAHERADTEDWDTTPTALSGFLFGMGAWRRPGNRDRVTAAHRAWIAAGVGLGGAA